MPADVAEAPGTIVIGDVVSLAEPARAGVGRLPALTAGSLEEVTMAALDDPKTLGRTRLSFADEAEIDEFVATLERFERGELTPDQWRAFRLVRGTYGQRQAGDAQMLRVKIPQGILDGAQLRALADVVGARTRGASATHDSPEPAAPFPEAPRRRAGHEAARRGRV